MASKLNKLKKFIESLQELFKTKDDSDKKGEEAIIEHKQRLNVNDPYVIIDPKTHTMKRMQKDKVLKEWEVATGKNTEEDGYTGWQKGLTPKDKDFYVSLPGNTLSVVATIPKRSTAPKYSEAFPGNVLRLADAYDPYHTPLIYAIHPVPLDRIKNWDTKKDVSTGCINCEYGSMHDITNSIKNTDTVYVLPLNQANYLGEYAGKLGIVYGHKPETIQVISPKTGKTYVNNMSYASEIPAQPEHNIFKWLNKIFK